MKYPEGEYILDNFYKIYLALVSYKILTILKVTLVIILDPLVKSTANNRNQTNFYNHLK